MDRVDGLTPLEISSGMVFGGDPAAPLLPKPRREISPRRALELAILQALRRPPCFATFSGGRDSSAVLAVAAQVARREGLPLPVPVTFRFPSRGSASDESEWQELVVSHLALDDWIRLDLDEEFDCLGPIGRRILRRHRFVFPIGPHAFAPAFELARGGSLLSGAGGDEALSTQSRVNNVLAGRAGPEPRDVVRVGFALAPRPIRRRVAPRWFQDFFEWLTPAARLEVRSGWAADEGDQSIHWGRRLRWVWRSRTFQRVLSTCEVVATDFDVSLIAPLADPLFVGALARSGGMNGFGDRTDAMQFLFNDVLPEQVISRRTKAVFGAPYWTHHSREFASRWSGRDVDQEIVDIDGLKRVWSRAKPPPQTLVLLKALWLAEEARGAGSADLGEQTREILAHRVPPSATPQTPSR